MRHMIETTVRCPSTGALMLRVKKVWCIEYPVRCPTTGASMMLTIIDGKVQK